MTALLTEQAAARRLAITMKRLRTMVRGGEIAFVKMPDGSVRFLPEDLASFVNRRRHVSGAVFSGAY